MLDGLNTCRICFDNNSNIAMGHNDVSSVSCLRCGIYSITDEAATNWKHSGTTTRQQANAAGWIREHQGAHITTDDIGLLLNLELPTAAERADKLLMAIARKFPKVGEEVTLRFGQAGVLQWYGASWCEDPKEFNYLVSEFLIKGTGLLQHVRGLEALLDRLLISAKGFQHIEEMKQRRPDTTIGFCAMWFDKRVTPLWKEAISPAIGAAGYDPKRIDTHEHNNRIDDEIMAMIRRSKFVVADFLGNRGGVYFEAGFAMGLGIPVIWTCREKRLHKVHFDNRQYSFVTWEYGQMEDFKKRLQNRIEATIGRGPLLSLGVQP